MHLIISIIRFENGSPVLAYGKIILLGEHAVLYGHKAIASSIPQTITAHVSSSDSLHLNIPAWNIQLFENDDSPFIEALKLLCKTLKIPCNFYIHVETTLPLGVGLGSSSAWAVAVTQAMCHATQQTDYDIETLANTLDVCFHGTTSGLDVAIALNSGVHVFERGKAIVQSLSMPPLSFAIGICESNNTTKSMIDLVTNTLQSNPKTYQYIEHLGDLAHRGINAIIHHDWNQLGSLLTNAHQSLQKLGVSSKKLDHMVTLACDTGALGSKLTGAGGGGAVIAFCSQEASSVIEVWKSHGYDAFETIIGSKQHDV